MNNLHVMGSWATPYLVFHWIVATSDGTLRITSKIIYIILMFFKMAIVNLHVFVHFNLH